MLPDIFKLLYFPLLNFPDGWWGSGFLNNTPDLKGDIIYARNMGKNNKKLVDSFPSRKIFMFVGLIDKGMLFPIHLTDGEVKLSPNYSLESDQPIPILADPRQFYTVYSEEFSRAIAEVYNTHPV